MRTDSATRLGIVAFNPIQYQVPLYRRLTENGRIHIDVMFLTDTGLAQTLDPGFGREISWDIDLTAGYPHSFLSTREQPRRTWSRIRRLRRWLRGQDAVVVHGYSSPWMLATALLCLITRTPYLMRGESRPEAESSRGARRQLRNLVARIVVSRSAGALAIGELNDLFYRKFGQDTVFWAPYSVDDRRFARVHSLTKEVLLSRHNLPADPPLVVVVGKLVDRKRPLDVLSAFARLRQPATLLFVGEGQLRDEVERRMDSATTAVTGFVNQEELPAYYQAADVLVLASEMEPWGLVVNEAMAAGVVPVVSDRVGSGPDLVDGVGRIFPVGDVAALASSLEQALDCSRDPATVASVLERVAKYDLGATANGFEEAAIALRA